MVALDAIRLLEVCERGRGATPVERALLLLEAVDAAAPEGGWASLPLGRRDARILELRARTLGPVLETETRCPGCDERLELDLPVEELRDLESGGGEAEGSAVCDGYEVHFRLPTSGDLLAAGEGEGAAERLLARCVMEVRREGRAASPSELPPSAIEALGAAMAEADPLADLQLALTCPACGHRWRAPFDPSAFFWREVEAWAPRLLEDVHRLAGAYGWTESEILGLSPWRRAHYLALVGGSA